MAADAYPPSLYDREQPDLHVLTQLYVVSDDHAAKGDADVSPDAVAE
jgi:hypothetical protein